MDYRYDSPLRTQPESDGEFHWFLRKLWLLGHCEDNIPPGTHH